MEIDGENREGSEHADAHLSIDRESDAQDIRKWERAAFASMALSLSSPGVAVVGLVFLHNPIILLFWFGPALLALALGIAAAKRIDKSGGRRRGIYFATAGVVMALLWAGFVFWVMTNVMFD